MQWQKCAQTPSYTQTTPIKTEVIWNFRFVKLKYKNHQKSVLTVRRNRVSQKPASNTASTSDRTGGVINRRRIHRQPETRTSFGTAQFLSLCACLTFPCCLPPRWSGQADSPCVGVWQSSVWSWTCSSAPWQSLEHPHLTWSERESRKEALFTHQRSSQSRTLAYFRPFCLYLHV